MAKQLVIYDKESGVISHIMSFNFDIETSHFEKFGLNKAYDFNKMGVFFEDDKVYINIKKDRIINGILTQQQSRKEVEKPTSASESVFDEIQYSFLPQHIALITPWNEKCGISNYSKDLLDNLLCKVTIFCEKNNVPEYENPKVKIIPCWTNRDTSYDYLIELIKKNKIDVVHVQYNHDLLNAGQLKIFGNELKAAGIRSIMTLHSSKGGVDVYGKHFDQLIVHSKTSADDIIGVNTTKEQISIINIGTKNSHAEKSKKIACIEKHLDYNRPIISNFGFFLPQKGIKEQIQALQILKNKYQNILLLVVCALHIVQNREVSEKYYHECKQLVDDLKLNDNVFFITDYLPLEDSISYLQCSDLIVLPYVNSAAQAASSAGRTILTALRPMLVTNIEIFSDLDDVVIKIEPRDVKVLAETIDMILKDKELQQILVKKIKKFIEKSSWENISRDHMRVYKSLGDIKIDIEGQVYSYFSASVVNRNLACALHDLGVDVSLKSVNLAENINYVMGDKTSELVKKKQNGIITVRHQFPPNFSDFNSRTKIAYLPVETSVPEDWVEAIDKNIDFVWVYTQHGKELMRKAGVTKPVEVIRCGIDENLFNKYVIPIDLSQVKDSYTKQTIDIDENTFVFLFVGHAQERKNFKTMFKSYLAEFRSNENVVFVIKSYDGGEVHKTIQELVDYVSGVLNKPKHLLPKFLYIYEDTDPNVLPSYYAAANVMCQCSRAEGFGKPIVEAMALGIPSIVVLWSGPKDFCTEKNSFPVPFTLVKSSYHVQSKNMESVWADTKIDDLRNVMRFCFENPKEVKKRGQEALIDSERWLMKNVVFDVIKFVRKYDL
jgi:glycosyltransferase involved in cell wall biosynthesis